MEVCNKFENLKGLLEQKQIADDTTFGLVFIPNKLNIDDIIAIRTASKWCDVTVCVILNAKLTAKQHKILQDAGVSILLDCPQKAPELSLNSRNINSGFILKVVLAVMPSAIAVQLAEVDLLKVMLRINDSYQNMFTPIYVQTPVGILTEEQTNIRDIILQSSKIVKSNKNKIEKTITSLNSLLKQEGFVGFSLEVVDNKGYVLTDGSCRNGFFINVSVKIGGINIQDGIQINIS